MLQAFLGHSARATTEKAKIAFVSQPRDPIAATDAQVGSVTIVMWELAKRIAAKHDVVVLAPRGKRQPLEETYGDGVRIRRVPLAFRLLHKALDLGTGLVDLPTPYFASPLFFREYGIGVAHALRKEQPDIIHVQNTTHFLPLFHRAVPKSRLILHVHDEFLALLPERIIKPRLKHVGAVVTCSDFVTRSLQEHLPWLAARIHTVGNGVDTQLFRPAQQPAGSDRFRILYVGRLSPEKGIHDLVKAFARLAEQNESVQLDLIGPHGMLPLNQIKLLSGDTHIAALRPFYGATLWAQLDRQVLHARSSYWHGIEQNIPSGVRARIRLHGQLPQKALVTAYQQTHVFVMPSVCMEPFGMPLVEAMASGLPCIATRAGGIPGILTDGETGLLVERATVEALTGALSRLANDGEYRAQLGIQARHRAEKYFDWSVAANRLACLYRSN